MSDAPTGQRHSGYSHERTWYRVEGTVVRYLAQRPPLSAPYLFADRERLIDLLTTDNLLASKLPPEEIQRLVHLPHPRTESEPDQRFFSELERWTLPRVQSELPRLRDDRALVGGYVFSNLGVYRANFFVHLYGDLTLAHAHPFLPREHIIVGPWYFRSEKDLLRRKRWLLPWSERLKLEQSILRRLWEHDDLTVVRAFEWLCDEDKSSLSEWEREDGACILISEGFYYFHALERAIRYGWPGIDSERSIERNATDLGLIRGTEATRRLNQVMHWFEAAIASETLRQHGEQHLERHLSKWPLSIRAAIRFRVPFIPALHSDHPIHRCVKEHCSDSLQALEPLHLFHDDAGGSEIVESIARFLNRHARESETLQDYQTRIRPVVDIDVFAARDFNALVFRFETDHEQGEAMDLSGVVFVSTTIDFLEDWKKHRSKVEEIRSLFTLLGIRNLQTALEGDLLRAERLKSVSTVARIVQAVAATNDELPCAAAVRAQAADGIREIELQISEPLIRQRVSAIRAAVEDPGATPSARTLDDLTFYTRHGRVKNSAPLLDLRALIEGAWSDRTRRFILSQFGAAPLLQNLVDYGLLARGEQDALLHAFDNILANAAEAIASQPSDTPLAQRVIRVESKVAESYGPFTPRCEVSLRFVDFAPNSGQHNSNPNEMLLWFQPGFSSGKDPLNHSGFGLAAAWKTLARHNGRIWARREVVSAGLSGGSPKPIDATVVTAMLPLVIDDQTVGDSIG